MYQALYRKYRPRVFDDVVGQRHITETLKNQLISGRLSHAYLFTGTRGTGKTTCAKILARAVNCENPQQGNPCNQCPACLGIENGSNVDVLEIDAASNNGVDNIRALRDDSIYSPATVKKRVYIIDEVHMLSTQAFNALLKIMEEPPEHLMFILATTELNKVPATILSRCQRFSFKRIQPTDIAQRLEEVAEKENIDLEPAAATLLARLSDGALRDALSLLDQCTMPGGSLSAAQVYEVLGLAGNVKTASLMQQIARGNTSAALELFDQLYSAGKDVASLFSELSSLGRDLLVLKTSGNQAMLVGGYDDETLKKLAKAFTFEGLMNCVGEFQQALSGFARSANRRTDGELCIMRVCDPTLRGDGEALAARLAKLEAALENPISFAPAPPVIPPAPAPEPKPEEKPQPTAETDSPPWDEAPPPWDEEPPPEEWTPPEPPAPAEPKEAPKAAAKEAPKADNPPKEGSDGPKSPMSSSDFWPQLAKEVGPKVGIPASIYLGNPETTAGIYKDGKLTVVAASPFVLRTLDKEQVASLIAQTAEKYIGSAPEVRFVLTGTELETGDGDSFDQLLSTAREMDNITII